MSLIRNFAAVAAVGLLSGVFAGCGGGGPYFQMKLNRQVTEGRPVWVGVYLLSKETALDGKENAELTNKETARGFSETDGIMKSYVQPVYPGKEGVEIPKEEIKKNVTTLLVVANFPKAQDCARMKIAVKPGKDIKYRISIDDKCLKVEKKYD